MDDRFHQEFTNQQNITKLNPLPEKLKNELKDIEDRRNALAKSRSSDFQGMERVYQEEVTKVNNEYIDKACTYIKMIEETISLIQDLTIDEESKSSCLQSLQQEKAFFYNKISMAKVDQQARSM